MNTQIREKNANFGQTSETHPLIPADGAVISAMRATLGPQKGLLQGTAARPIFDDIMGHVVAPEGITYEPDTVGGIKGWWCHPFNARSGEVILYLHGGWYVWGSARAYRHFVGHIAVKAGTSAFVADYRLAPEHPFPAGLLDAEACYFGFVDRGIRRIAIVGDSAGGGLGLALLALATNRVASGNVVPACAAVLSPVTDLTFAGPSWETRADADLYFTRLQCDALVEAYLGAHDRADPLASPLFGSLAGLPPVRVHVGEDEMLLDDSRRYAERAAAAGVDAKVDVWQGMLHVFPNGVGRLEAATLALDSMGTFLAERLAIGDRNSPQK